MDAFYAAVEQLDNPALQGQPVLIGSTSGRGVVLTASYEARPFGVGSAMPMAQALRRCPNAVVVPPRFERYTDFSAQMMAVFADFRRGWKRSRWMRPLSNLPGPSTFLVNPQRWAGEFRSPFARPPG